MNTVTPLLFSFTPINIVEYIEILSHNRSSQYVRAEGMEHIYNAKLSSIPI